MENEYQKHIVCENSFTRKESNDLHIPFPISLPWNPNLRQKNDGIYD